MDMYSKMLQALKAAQIKAQEATAEELSLQSILDEFNTKVSQVLGNKPRKTATPKKRKKVRGRSSRTPRMHFKELELRVLRYMASLRKPTTPVKVYRGGIQNHASSTDLQQSGPSSVLIQARISACLTNFVRRGWVKKTGKNRSASYSLTAKGRKHYKATKA